MGYLEGFERGLGVNLNGSTYASCVRCAKYKINNGVLTTKMF